MSSACTNFLKITFTFTILTAPSPARKRRIVYCLRVWRISQKRLLDLFKNSVKLVRQRYQASFHNKTGRYHHLIIIFAVLPCWWVILYFQKEVESHLDHQIKFLTTIRNKTKRKYYSINAANCEVQKSKERIWHSR